jgi:hypothetical protein
MSGQLFIESESQSQMNQSSTANSIGSTSLVERDNSSTISNSLTSRVSLFSLATDRSVAARRDEFTNPGPSSADNWERYEQAITQKELGCSENLYSHARGTRAKLLVAREAQRRGLTVDNSAEESKEESSDKKRLRTHEEGYRKLRENSDFCRSIGLGLLTPIIMQSDNARKRAGGNRKQTLTADEICSSSALKQFNSQLTGERGPSLQIAFNSLNPNDFIEKSVVCILLVLKDIRERDIAARSAVRNSSSRGASSRGASSRVAIPCEIDLRELHEVWYGVGQFIDEIETLEVRNSITNRICGVHTQLIEDLIEAYRLFETHFEDRLSHREIARNYAEFYIETKFSKILLGSAPKPYASQRELLEFVSDCNIRHKPFLATYTTIMGMGKTSTLPAIADAAPNKVILYICPEGLQAVREKVGSLIHSRNGLFALVSVVTAPDGKRSIVVKEQNECKKHREAPTFLLGGVEECVEIFKSGKPIQYKKRFVVKRGKKSVDEEVDMSISLDDIIVFFDEPTVTLDEVNGPMVKYLADFYNNMPECVIFSSATHPAIEKLDQLRRNFSAKYPEAVFKTVDSSVVKIGTQLNTMAGNLIIPHMHCNTPAELERFIGIVDGNLMFKKSYTFSLVSSMYEKLVELGLGHMIAPEYHFPTYMLIRSNRVQMSIGNLGMIYLRIVLELSRTNPDIIQEFNSIVAENVPINYDDLVDTARNLRGQTFISCRDPYQQMMARLGEFMQRIKERLGAFSYSQLVRNYESEVTRVESSLTSKFKGEYSKLSQEEKDRMMSTAKSNVSTRVIPEMLGLNGTTIPLNKHSEIPEGEEYDNLMFMSLLGVVVYRKDSHSSYHDMVINMMNNSQCIYVFADSSLNYGNSFPFNNGIILDEMSFHSANTLLQLMGRAGRPGRSAYATIYAGDAVIAKLLEPIYNPEYVDMELINIQKAIKIADIKDVVKANEVHRNDFLSALKSHFDSEQVLNEYIENLEYGLRSIILSVTFDLSRAEKNVIYQVLREIKDLSPKERTFARLNRLCFLLDQHSENIALSSAIREIIVLSEHHRRECCNAESLVLIESNKKFFQELLQSISSSGNNAQQALEEFIVKLESTLDFNIDSLCFELSHENKLLICQVREEVQRQAVSSRAAARIEHFRALLVSIHSGSLSGVIRKIIDLSDDHSKKICESKSLIVSRLKKRISIAKERILSIYNNFQTEVQKFTDVEKIDREHLRFFGEYHTFEEEVINPLVTQVTDYGLSTDGIELTQYTKEIFRKSVDDKKCALNSIVETRERAEREAELARQHAEREAELARQQADREAQRVAALNGPWVRGGSVPNSSSSSSSGVYQAPRGNFRADISLPGSSGSVYQAPRGNFRPRDDRASSANSFGSNEGSWRRQSQNQTK